MTANKKQTKQMGSSGEELAYQYLQQQGYAILETNWRLGHNEVDIIAYYEGLIVFVEVKTRNSEEYGDPSDAVDNKKQRIYVRMADAYVRHKERDEEVRFDIITVVIEPHAEPRIEHMMGAFSAIDIRR